MKGFFAVPLLPVQGLECLRGEGVGAEEENLETIATVIWWCSR